MAQIFDVFLLQEFKCCSLFKNLNFIFLVMFAAPFIHAVRCLPVQPAEAPLPHKEGCANIKNKVDKLSKMNNIHGFVGSNPHTSLQQLDNGSILHICVFLSLPILCLVNIELKSPKSFLYGLRAKPAIIAHCPSSCHALKKHMGRGTQAHDLVYKRLKKRLAQKRHGYNKFIYTLMGLHIKRVLD